MCQAGGVAAWCADNCPEAVTRTHSRAGQPLRTRVRCCARLLQVPRRKVRHICDVQVSNLFTADEGREARATYWYRLEAATDTGPWATFYTSEEVRSR